MIGELERMKSTRPTTRRLRRRKRKTSKLLRILLMAVVSATCIVTLFLVIHKAAKPYLLSYGESKEIADLKSEINSSLVENKALKDSISFLQTPQGKEVEARRLGFVKDGETSVVVEQPHESPSVSLQSTTHQNNSILRTAGRKILSVFARKHPAQ
jgi:cell division protein FtsL